MAVLNPITMYSVVRGTADTIVAVQSDSLGNLADATGAYLPLLGYKVSKTEDISVATGVDLFTVTGKVLITLWTGEVTNAFHTTVTDYKLRVKTVNSDLCAATNVSSAVVGYMWSLSGDAGLTLLTGSSYAVSVSNTADMNGLGFANRVVGLAGGSCVLQSLRTAGDTGDAQIHTLWYFPLESGASVVAV